MKTILSFMLCAMLCFAIATPVTEIKANDNVKIEFVAQADEGTEASGSAGTTPQDVAEVIENYVEPTLQEIKELLEDAPSSDASTSTKINYWIFGAIGLVSVLLGLFLGGGPDNRMKNLRIS